MNKAVTSKEELILTAVEIAISEGVQKVSVRNIAKARSISVGALYNYFPAKADLIFAVVGTFWNEVIGGLNELSAGRHCFPEFVQNYYDIMYRHLSDFEHGWLTQMENLAPEEKQKGREMENQYFGRLKDMLFQALDNDTSIRTGCWTEKYGESEFVDFLFLQIMGLLRTGQKDCTFLCKTIQRILY